MTNIRLDSPEGFVRITLDNGVIRLALLPEIGGKIIPWSAWIAAANT